MNAPQQVVVSPDIEIKMQDVLKAQRESYLQEGYVSAEARIDRLNRAIDVLVRHADRISEAINKDFVCRPDQINLMTDVAGFDQLYEALPQAPQEVDEGRETTFNLPAGPAGWSLAYSIPAQRRCWHRRALELPGGNGIPATGRHSGCR